MSVVGNRIKKRLAALGKSQVELAAAVGMRQQGINSIVAGKVVRPKRLREIAEFLETTEKYLLGESHSPTVTPQILLPDGTNSGTDSRLTELIEPETRAGMGSGGISTDSINVPGGGDIVISADAIRDRWWVPTSFVRGELHIRGKAAVIEVYGDSGYDPANPAAPGSLFPGDRVIVDMGDRSPSPPGPFLCYDGLTMVVKLVELVRGSRDPARVRLSSRNPGYSPAEVTEDEAQIIGRVRGRISAM